MGLRIAVAAVGAPFSPVDPGLVALVDHLRHEGHEVLTFPRPPSAPIAAGSCDAVVRRTQDDMTHWCPDIIHLDHADATIVAVLLQQIAIGVPFSLTFNGDRSAIIPSATAIHLHRLADLTFIAHPRHRHMLADQDVRDIVQLPCPDGSTAREQARAYASAMERTVSRLRQERAGALPDGPGCMSRQDAVATVGLALAAEERGDDAAAIAAHRQALRTAPDLPAAWGNLGTLLARHGALAAGAYCLRRALALAPADAQIHVNHGLMELTHGRWRSGFLHLAWLQRTVAPPPVPLWDGSPLAGRRLLLYAGAGLGDTVQDLRFVPSAIAHAQGAVVVRVQSSLRWWAQAVLPEGTIAADPPPPVDVCYPMHHLPGLLGITPERIPPPCAPRCVVPSRWDTVLAPDGRLRVGLCWKGSQRGRVDRGRSLDPALLAPLGAVPGIRWWCLQQRPEAPPPWLEVDATVDAGPEAFRDTVTILRHLDLVITSDTSVAHVAGSLGCRVWLLLQWLPDWRWLLEREDTPWYPGMRLFRQRTPGDWSEVVQRIVAQLAQQRICPGQAGDGSTVRTSGV